MLLNNTSLSVICLNYCKHWRRRKGGREMNKRKRSVMAYVVIVAFIAAAGLFTSAVLAGNLEPPTSAVDSAGNPVSTVQVPHTWSQTLPAAERFELVMGGAAVLDKETGLVWEQRPDSTTHRWKEAIVYCYNKVVGDRKGWRIPTIEELASLVDMDGDGDGLTLPRGHPFIIENPFPNSFYMSCTTWASDTDSFLGVRFVYGDDPRPGSVSSGKKGDKAPVWCVRGGHGYDAW
jgi:hypothetical protein